MSQTIDFDELVESRYLTIVSVAARLALASDWVQVAASVSTSLARGEEHRRARLWGRTVKGVTELARSSSTANFPMVTERQLALAAEQAEPTGFDGGGVLVGLVAGGVSLGVLEVCDASECAELLGHVAPIVACRVALLAAQGIDDLVLAPLPVDEASDYSGVMSSFAIEAKRMLDHDRLSAYLLTDDGRSFERFAVATSPIVPGEGLVIPFGDVGLRHVVITNGPLVSEDLGCDARIVGREDRIISKAGFRGLLSVPLRLSGRPIGVLNFVSREVGFYREQDIPVAQQIADQISAFLENLRRQRGMRDVIQREATERERTRLTGELHRVASESALAIIEVAIRLRDHLSGGDAWASRQADSVIALAKLALIDARRAVSDMSPVALESHTLEEAVESAVGRLRHDQAKEVTCAFSGDTSRLFPAVTRAAYYILQVALSNVHQHSDATKVHVELRCDEQLTLIVTDNGRGFDHGRAGSHLGFGLPGMLERAQALGGSLMVDTELGGGTAIRFDLPLPVRPQPPSEIAGPARAELTPGSLRVVVAHPLPSTRAGLTAMLEDGGGMRVVGTANTADELEGAAHWLRPDVIVLDLRLAGPCPADVVKRLVSCSPASRVLLVVPSSTAEPQKLVLDAGANGAVSADVDGLGLVDTVRGVASGATVIRSPQTSRSGPSVVTTSLSGRELEILALITSGHTNIEIGKVLFLAPKTIERHVATIVSKLGARNRAHAAGLAIAEGLVLFSHDQSGSNR